jgi:sn-glycerol 3-phosphate transport system permease protein
VNRRRRHREWMWAALFLAPALVVFGVFVYYPLVKTAQLSLYRVNLFGRGRTYVGLSQLTDTATSPEFLHSLGRSVVLVLMTVPAALVLGVVLALLANRPVRGIRVFRTIFSSTIATSVAVASVMFLTLLNPSTGWLRFGLTKIGVLGAGDTIDVFHDPRWALPVVSATILWSTLGATFVIVLAGLQSIPEELHEAARLDGAGPIARFWGVTLPLLSPTLLFLGVVGVTSALLSFGEIDILTQGGPSGHTNVLAYALYQTAFVDFDQGKAAAMSMLLFAFVALLAGAQLALLRKRVHVGG